MSVFKFQVKCQSFSASVRFAMLFRPNKPFHTEKRKFMETPFYLLAKLPVGAQGRQLQLHIDKLIAVYSKRRPSYFIVFCQGLLFRRNRRTLFPETYDK